MSYTWHTPTTGGRDRFHLLDANCKIKKKNACRLQPAEQVAVCPERSGQHGNSNTGVSEKVRKNNRTCDNYWYQVCAYLVRAVYGTTTININSTGTGTTAVAAMTVTLFYGIFIHAYIRWEKGRGKTMSSI